MSSWKIDPKSGDYVMDSSGKPQPVDDLTMPAYYRVKIKRGQWLYAPDNNYGSDIYLIKKRFAGQDVSTLKNIIEKALQPMIDDKRAKDVVAGASQSIQYNSRSDLAMDVQIEDAQGQVQQLSLPTLGV